MSRFQRDDTSTIDVKAICDFLQDVWRTNSGKGQYVFVGIRKRNSWRNVALRSRASLERLMLKHWRDADLYFCPNHFTHPECKKEYATPTRWGHCDIDEGDVSKFDIPPSFLWQTSPGRHQGLWLWNSFEQVKDAEAYSRELSKNGDKGGYAITKMLRIPGTNSYKYPRPHHVKMISEDWGCIEERPEIVEEKSKKKMATKGRLTIEHMLKRGTVRQYMFPASEGRRSDMICGLVMRLNELGAERDDIVEAVLRCPSFIDKRGHNERQACIEVDRILSRRAA